MQGEFDKPIRDVWQEVDTFLEETAERYKMSFGLEYSSIVDWVADFTPRRNHPRARDYPVWQGTGGTREDAIIRALELAKAELIRFELTATD